ncbi:hypothetical protein COY25_02595 [Candidatus Uhrbacteria bacterium CG_4_10_14_0_2_um_filter_41_7]|nr:MAG: hypothetical protein COY25_02595 [Candidatus Uhrbacteria bacterium CG_4_10_14_0_2_um_filter_41_7]
MQIAIDARFYGLEHAGLGRYTVNLIRELTKLDQENQYTLFVWEKYKDLDLPDNFSIKVVNAKHHSFGEQILLASAIGIGKYDIVHFPHFIVPILNLTTPFIVTIHDLIKNEFDSKETSTLPLWQFAIKNQLYRLDMWWAVNRSRAIISPSKHVKQRIIETYHISGEKIYPIYEGFDSTITEISINSDSLSNQGVIKPYILYVGKSYVHKQVEFIIDELENIPKNVALVLVGEKGIFWERTLARVKNKQVLNRVHHLGFVNDAVLASLYQNALCFVSASLDEGFSLPPLEAINLKCPLILSDIPVHREIYQDSAIYFDPRNHSELAEKVRLLAKNSQYFDKQISTGLDLIKSYNWGSMTKQIINLYQNTQIK